jgi:hypothetical protein
MRTYEVEGMNRSWRRFALIPAILLIAAAVVAVLPAAATNQAIHGTGMAELRALSQGTSADQARLTTEAVPLAELDTCLHCHLTGEITSLWVPMTRWLVFGAFGLVFAYGAARSASAWRTRAPWKPLYLRAADWVDERFELRQPLTKILKKPVPMFATRWMYCLGGITFALFAVQGITGVMLAFYYQPTPEGAYASIQYIENEVRFGSAIRAIHHWAANGMVVMVVAHAIRVFITGAYKPPRELNWVNGVLLLVITLGFGFTGYLLPWDQTAFWASTVGTEIAGAEPIIGNLALVFLRGGWDVTGITLSRFYALHIMVLPALIVFLMVSHFLMIRRQGIARPL